MGQNSFLIKGWMITLIVVLITLLLDIENHYILSVIGIVVSLCFWYLDAFFLKTEKLFRYKYEWVIRNRTISDDFFYDLNPYNEKMWNSNIEHQPTIISLMFSKTLAPIYLVPILPLIAYIFLGGI